jgi:hypothetical protein
MENNAGGQSDRTEKIMLSQKADTAHNALSDGASVDYVAFRNIGLLTGHYCCF